MNMVLMPFIYGIKCLFKEVIREKTICGERTSYIFTSWTHDLN